ncbi:unnamed protein product [Paramecium sonneborni]|uniref:Uncharacterized protein n=1 Tax=Paramecium sonneborni TaxID=65129 RepID=A0A8S1RNV0_9CILI|nr:unnamed protein product [Paramecium sonneborni]
MSGRLYPQQHQIQMLQQRKLQVSTMYIKTYKTQLIHYFQVNQCPIFIEQLEQSNSYFVQQQNYFIIKFIKWNSSIFEKLKQTQLSIIRQINLKKILHQERSYCGLTIRELSQILKLQIRIHQ